jgi:hypothetical protein
MFGCFYDVAGIFLRIGEHPGIREAVMEAFMFGVFAIIVVLSSIRLAMRMQD